MIDEIPKTFVIIHQGPGKSEQLPIDYDLVAMKDCKRKVQYDWNNSPQFRLYSTRAKNYCQEAKDAAKILNQILGMEGEKRFIPVGSEDFNHLHDSFERLISVNDVFHKAFEKNYPVLYLTSKGELIDVSSGRNTLIDTIIDFD